MLRDYQLNALKEIKEYFKTDKHFVLSAAPSSGKTMISLEFIKQTPGRFLIITHGQNVLKDMWQKEIDRFLDEKTAKRITYGIPQSLSKKKMETFDYIIIDEAHEFTFADMTKTILKNNPQAKVLYLTGTPSKFIYQNKYKNGKYNIYIIPAEKLVQDGFVSDLYIGMFMTNVNIKDEDFNVNNDVIESSHYKLEGDATVKESVDNMLEALLNKLGSSFSKKRPNLYRNIKKMPSLGLIGKTMIACRSIKQAVKVNDFLLQKGYCSVLSNSENDSKSENIIGKDGFLYNKDIKFLIVVDRGILGFNVPELENVVDMTCSRNIDRTYQLYARVMRKHDKVKDKFFFKLTTESEELFSKFIMEASIFLMWENFIKSYDGKNLNTMKIPVKRLIKKNPIKSLDKRFQNKNVHPIMPPDTSLADAVTAVGFMTDLLHKKGDSLHEYAKMSFGDIRAGVFDKRIRISFNSLKEANDYYIGESDG